MTIDQRPVQDQSHSRSANLGFASRRIGATDVAVTQLSFGCSSIGNLGGVVSGPDAQDLLDFVWNAGVRYFDTAPHYGRGLSEMRLGRFLAARKRTDFTLSTKVGRVLTPGERVSMADGFVDPLPFAVHYDYSAAGIEQSLTGSGARLGTDYFDIVYVHDIGTLTHGALAGRHLQDLLSSGLPYLARLKAEGRIGAYGLGVNENEICIRVLNEHHIDAILLAGRWTLLDRSAEAELIPLCRERNVSIVLGGVFNSGILATGPQPGAWYDYAPASKDILDRVIALQGRCTDRGVELAQAALHFGLSKPEIASVLIGSGKISSMERNLAMISMPLPAGFAEAMF